MSTDFGQLQPGTLRVGDRIGVIDLPPANHPSLKVGDTINIRTGPLVATLVQDQFLTRSWHIAPPSAAGSAYLAAFGQGALDAFGKLIVADVGTTGPSGIMALAQGTGAPLTGSIWNSSKTAFVGFTIESTAGAADVGVVVYWQRWEVL